jgi:membrane fusion protein (multidrug efflux system)
MFANVTVQAGEPRDIVAVPRTAVSFSLYGDSVFVASPAPPASGGAQAAGAPEKKLFKIERRFVRTGEMHDADVAILQGVSAGETVISEGQIKLQNGALVTIDPKAVLQPPAIRQKE